MERISERLEGVMNLQRGDKGIGWCDATWSPVTGCKNNCSYCYARRISHRFGRSFEPTFHPERLEEPYKLKKPSKIFVCSMGELFGPWVPREWQEAVLCVAAANPQHTFQFLTKFPRGAWKFNSWATGWPINAWLGATVNSSADAQRIDDLYSSPAPIIYISAEPLLGSFALVSSSTLSGLDWIIIGAQTNPNIQPRDEWVDYLVAVANCWGIPVFMKSNLDYEPKRREFPRGGGDE